MTDKGYDHPLYSLDLLPLSHAGDDEPRFCLFVPQGRLVVRAELRRLGAGLSTGQIEDALALALTRHRIALPGFSRRGLTAAWADNMLHWRQRMIEKELLRQGLQGELDLASRTLRGLGGDGHQIWGQLSLAARMAGLAGTITRGRAPQASLALGDALRQASLRASEPVPAALLLQFGFGAAEQAELSGLADRIAAARQQVLDLTRKVQQASDTLVTIRAALCGDLRRLCQAAPYVVGPEHRKVLQVQTLFDRRRTSMAVAGLL
jgi:hypothetical protein